MFLLSLAVLSGCGEKEQAPENVYPLESFSLSKGNTVCHGRIDYSESTVSVGVIQYGAEVSGVSYSLADGATIEPDPQTLVGAWPESQEFTVSLDGEETVYTVILTAYAGQTPEPGDDLPPAGDVLFYTNFEQTDGTPDPDVWTLCKPGSGNWCRYMSESYDQAYVEDGVLVLKGERVDGKYKAGGLETTGKVSATHARWEICARFETAQGAWPAIWLMPEKQSEIYEGWPIGGEVDIMEQISNDEFVYQTLHSNYTYNLGIKNPNNTVTCPYNVGEFNTYAVDMTPEAIIFYVNGEQTLSYPNLHLTDEAEKKQWPFDGEYYLIVNVAIGGEGTWPGAIDDSQLPARMEIAWIRVSDLGYGK